MIGIIDIGTNTIRLIGYEKNIEILNIAVRSEIITDTEDGILSDFGADKLCNSIKYLIKEKDFEKIYALATESIRALKNKEEVKEKIYKETGILIDILSGEDEAECVYLGVKKEIEEDSGIIIDLGGGSVEIIGFTDDRIKFLKSYSVGTKRIKKEFSYNLYPTEEEIKNIEDYLEKVIEKEEIEGNLYITGGTAKSSIKIYNYLKKEEKPYIKVKEIQEILDYIKEKTEEDLKRIFDVRYDTIAVGIIIMKMLADIFGKEEIYVKSVGIREGYIIKRDEID